MNCYLQKRHRLRLDQELHDQAAFSRRLLSPSMLSFSWRIEKLQYVSPFRRR